jgi:hypothetical protein
VASVPENGGRHVSEARPLMAAPHSPSPILGLIGQLGVDPRGGRTLKRNSTTPMSRRSRGRRLRLAQDRADLGSCSRAARTGPGPQASSAPGRAARRRRELNVETELDPIPSLVRICAAAGPAADRHGSRVSAFTWTGRTTVKCRRSSVATSVSRSRSASAMTEASVVPSGRLP